MALFGKRNMKEKNYCTQTEDDDLENGQSVEKQPQFEKGTIRRLYFENFVTYTNVEFRPGPQMNVIVGPNGTGKSTVVCGICIGLAGKPGILGRATSVVDYIKHGCQKAVIEIDLHNPGNQPFCIRREILRSANSTSSWFINGQSTSQKNVEELVHSCGIQIGNLCQFLPQDKVSDFAKMSPQELLQNTEKSVNIQLHEDHKFLISDRDFQREREQNLTKLKERLERETGLNARLEQDIRNNEERESQLEKIKFCQMKRAWMLYEERRLEYEQIKTEKKRVKKELDTMSQLFEPLKQRCNTVKNRSQETSQLMNQQMNEVRKHNSLANQALTSLEEIEEKLQEIDHELANKKQDESNRLQKRQELLQQLNVLKSEMANLDQQPDVQPQIERVNEDMRNVNGSMSQVQKQGDGIRQELTEIMDGQKGLTEELRRLQDVHRLRLQKLKQVHQDTYQAVMWLRENKKLFKATVHEPMLLTIDVKNSKDAKYVESRIPFKDLRAFICEDGDDLELFVQHVRDEQRLKVNVLMMPKQPTDSFQPNNSIDYFKSYQFRSFLRELFTCPEPVMRYLCLMYQVHSIPVGNKFTKDHINEVVRKCAMLNIIYTEDHEYFIRKSKYSGQSSTCCSEIRDPTLLTSAGDQQKEKSLMNQLQMKQQEQHQKEVAYAECQAKFQDLEREMERLRIEKKRLFDKKNERRTLQQKIGVKEDSIRRLDSEAIDLKREEALASGKRKKVEGKKCDLLQEVKQLTQQSINLSMARVRSSLQHVNLVEEVNALTNEIRDKESNLQTLQNNYDRVSDRAEHIRLAARNLLSEAQRVSNVRDGENLSEHLHQTFRCLPNSMEEIDTCIHDMQARVDCISAVEASVVKDYHDRKAEIEKLQRDVEKNQTELENHKKEIETVKRRWITPLQRLMERINKKFSEFFRIMKCAGEVELKAPENPEDYEKYGVCIKVKFRDSEQLRELNAHHQSGGERSVSTVLYLMSLQELTMCPFRCVDEINQGMDPVNERTVFELIVRTATCDRTSQYFLLTPKLLPDLEYNENMTILFVHNGPLLLNHTDWSIKKFLRRRALIK